MRKTITEPHLQSWLDQAIRISQAAGDAILVFYTGDFSVYQKSDASPLTDADMAAHRVIMAGLDDLETGFPILSEESAQIPFDERSRWETYWLVDPLDGTREFIKRRGEFTVNIALIHHGRPVLGVVHIPVRNRTYFAAKGLGAHRWDGNRDEDSRDTNATIPIHVRTQVEPPLRILGSHSHASQLLDEYLAKASARFGEYDLVTMGSALKFCLVAEGAADFYPRFGPTSEWDTAAAHAIVLEAGGEVTDMGLNPLLYNRKDSLINPFFFVFGHRHHDWSAFVPEGCK
uniref:3'(2'),5'-bisphosphate nucleotidase CysQ n=1 Tax=Candidatus Kentrum sp. MB TaxID=2138164 RepID=A0A450XJ77_9GAMM|nr:MAG: 3'(2'),5'-bisphosphate nucleotidase [Candidatus Kentron sp. MB]VFK29373.1 MAG: 3'(2'),5'-bisphosphate nucleotidase [Candidatus Kentron sp. MB]VFK74766.1 MAG: 3'(2'),5'-bisphosphate nucleotidase [Candidatus Kentron sp. MB]